MILYRLLASNNNAEISKIVIKARSERPININNYFFYHQRETATDGVLKRVYKPVRLNGGKKQLGDFLYRLFHELFLRM